MLCDAISALHDTQFYRKDSKCIHKPVEVEVCSIDKIRWTGDTSGI
jgi:hypothetical protein